MDTVVVNKLKNGFLISPENNSRVVRYSECIFIEGYDIGKLAWAIQSMLTEGEKVNESNT